MRTRWTAEPHPEIGIQGLPPRLHSPVQTASWYARQEEQRAGLRATLTAALTRLVTELQQPPQFEQLQLVELLLGGQRRNKDVAALLDLDEKQVALRKHRLIRRLSRYVDADTTAETQTELPDPLDTLLSDIWADYRPTCPKRSTLGKYLLGTLDTAWQQYIDFHLHRLDCRFCRANLHDMQSEADRQQVAEQLPGSCVRPSASFVAAEPPTEPRRPGSV